MKDIEKNKKEIAAAWKILDSLKLIDTIFNHISIAFEGKNNSLTMLMNPDGFLPEQVNENNISVFPLKKYSNKDAIKLNVNPDGLQLHSELHLARKTGGVIVHTHSPYAIAVGNHKEGLLPLSQTAIEFVNDIEIVEYDGMFRKNVLSEQMKNFASKGGIALLRHHGILIISDNVEEATYLTYYIEEACKLQVISLSQGKTVTHPNKVAIKSAQQILKNDRSMVAKGFYNAFKRKLNND